jgi:hypothetical protein
MKITLDSVQSLTDILLTLQSDEVCNNECGPVAMNTWASVSEVLTVATRQPRQQYTCFRLRLAQTRLVLERSSVRLLATRLLRLLFARADTDAAC